MFDGFVPKRTFRATAQGWAAWPLAPAPLGPGPEVVYSGVQRPKLGAGLALRRVEQG